MKLRIFVKEIVPPCWFDVPLNPGAEFRHVANDILLNGFSSKEAMIAASNIAGIFMVADDLAGDKAGIVMQGPVSKQ